MPSDLTFDGAVRCEPRIDAWFDGRSAELSAVARRCFAVMRGCGDDVTELLHDCHQTACTARALGAILWRTPEGRICDRTADSGADAASGSNQVTGSSRWGPSLASPGAAAGRRTADARTGREGCPCRGFA